MATVADLVFAEVEEIVPVGEISPEFIHTQDCYVVYLREAKDLGSSVPSKPLLGVGGAMDLVKGAKRLIITMTHTNPDGSSKLFLLVLCH